VWPAPPPGQHRQHGHQQHTGQEHHRDLIGKERDLAVRCERTEVRRPFDQRMLDDVLERALFLGGLVFGRGFLRH
jgi:hypothetical protein